MPRKAKKKNKRMYFTQTTENAIIRYNNEDRPWIRDRIYRDHIQFAFEKLAENTITKTFHPCFQSLCFSI